MFRIFWRLVFLALLLSLLARCSPTHPPTPRGTPKDTATNTPKQLGDPATLLQDAQNKGHVLNLLEYTRALHAKYGRQPQDQQQTQTKLSGASVSAAGVTPNPGPPDNDLNSSLSFSTEQAKLYEVGNNIPLLNITTKTSWAGVIPIDPNSDLSTDYLRELPKKAGDDNYTIALTAPRSLFFWLWGAEGDKASKDDLIIWLQGGPGCSSLNGLFMENGPIRYDNITLGARHANDSWTTVADIVFVDQPVGTGYSMGQPTAYGETDVAEDFYHWWGNFLKIFPELKRKKLWIAAESYGGLYGPYISDHFYSQPDTYNLHGLLLIDGFITQYDLAQGATCLDFAKARNETLQFSDGQFADIQNASQASGYLDYSAKNLLYPLEQQLPSTPEDVGHTYEAYVSAGFNTTVFFDLYDIRWKEDYAHSIDSPLGNPNSFIPQDDTFLSNTSIRDYIHAPHISWVLCAAGNIFQNGTDTSPYPVYSVLPNVIEKSERTIIAHAIYDGLLLQNGTAVALQNLTWGGGRGFTEPPTQVVLDEQGGRVGTFTHDRKLSFVVAERGGHSIPGDDGLGGLALIRSLLGQRTLGGDHHHHHHHGGQSSDDQPEQREVSEDARSMVERKRTTAADLQAT